MTEKKVTLSYSVTSKIPLELRTKSNEINIKDVIVLKTTDKVTFNYGDYVLNAHAFNEYLEANLNPNIPLVMTKDEVLNMIKRLSLQLNHGGLDSLPMVCTDTDCPRYESCSIQLSGGTVPVGESCPIEKAELLNHVKRIAMDFDDLPSYADQLMAQGVAACELLKTRVYADMAKNPQAVIEVAKGIDRKGDAIYDRVDNPNQKIWSQINKTEQNLLKSLHMTMDQKKKEDKGKNNKNPDQLRELYKERLKQLKEKNKIKNDGGIIDVNINKGDIDEEVHNGTTSRQGDGGAEGSDGSSSTIPKRPRTEADGDASDSRKGPAMVDRTKDRIRKVKEDRQRSGEQHSSERDVNGGASVERNSQSGTDDDSMETVF